MKGNKTINVVEELIYPLLFFDRWILHFICEHLIYFQYSVSSCTAWRSKPKMMSKAFVHNHIFVELWVLIISKRKLRKTVRNQLICVVFSSYCNSVFPTKSDVYDKLICCYSMHLCSFKFMPCFDIIMKGSFGMTSDAQSVVTIVWSWNRICIGFYYLSKLTLFPSVSERFYFE